MADSVVKSAVDKLEEMALQEVKLQSEVGKKVKELKDELDWLRTFLRDADRRRRQQVDDYIEVWVRQTRELAFDVEDLLEEFFHKGELHCHGCFDLPSFLRWLRHSAAGLCARHAIFDDIDSINKRLANIKSSRETLNLESLASVCRPLARKRYTPWYTLNKRDIQDDLVGIEHEQYNLIQDLILDNSREQQTVIALTGKSGIGKTAVARYFFRKCSVSFDCAIWVHVPQKFRLVDLLSYIIQQACKFKKTEQKVMRSEDNIKEELEMLKGKRYLIVLDDVRTLEERNFLLAALPEGKGSRVLITTRLKLSMPSKVLGEGEANGSRCWHHIKEINKLTSGQIKELFQKRIFGNPNADHPPLLSIEKNQKLEELLKGLPLNVVLLAGLLRSKKPDEWENVIDTLLSSTNGQGASPNSERQQQEQEHQPQQDNQQQEQQPQKQQRVAVQFQRLSTTDNILTLSLDELSHHVKPCFLYFAAFKAEADIDAWKLIRLWVAEGFVQPKDGQTMEERGHDYLKYLVSRCLVHLVALDSSGNIVTVSIHQSVLDFAISEAHDTNFLQVHSSTTTLAQGSVRRLSFRNTYDMHISLVLAAPKLHSLLCDIPEAAKDETTLDEAKKLLKRARAFVRGRAHMFSIHCSRFLRVMDLKGVQSRDTIPEEIGWLIHLRYLGLAHTSLKCLPKSIKNLLNLQTLDITNTKIDHVTDRFWRIRTLRHVLAARLQVGPREYHVLIDLQTLHGVPWGQWAHNGAALRRMTNLRSLHAWKISKAVAGDALASALASLECLRSLNLDGEEGALLPLQNLLTMLVLRNLQCLRLHGKVMTIASPVQSQHYLLPNLTKLELCESKLSQDLVFLIAQLPNLIELMLGKGSYEEKDMVIPKGGFPELRKLQLCDLLVLERCFEQEHGSALPQLHDISIFSCPKLEMLPVCLRDQRHRKLFHIYHSPCIEKFIECELSCKSQIVHGHNGACI